jgi:hypothetical protein
MYEKRRFRQGQNHANNAITLGQFRTRLQRSGYAPRRTNQVFSLLLSNSSKSSYSNKQTSNEGKHIDQERYKIQEIREKLKSRIKKPSLLWEGTFSKSSFINSINIKI